MSPIELPILQPSTPTLQPISTPTQQAASARDQTWLRTARRARLLSWISLLWMTVEGVVGLIAGLDANALSVSSPP